jgi:hypothetical protein
MTETQTGSDQPSVASAASVASIESTERIEPTAIWIAPALIRRVCNRPRTILGFAAALLLLVGGLGSFLFVKPVTATTVKAAPLSTPTVSVVSLAEPIKPVTQPADRSLGALPATLAGMTRLSHQGALAMITVLLGDSSVAQADASGGAAPIVGGYVGDSEADQLVFIGNSVSRDPALKRRLARMSASGLAGQVLTAAGASTVLDVDSGALGGVVRCGQLWVTSSHETDGACVWVDGSTLGMVLAPDSSVGTAATLLATLRTAVEK